ncbi:hypothetical protein EJ02DRAFT_72976 [Clathrospora elynae]|uniref:Uncharacterized protein n=1 Tax=Clathrospora elynae TaxID=706981 RepID=A0A6A5SYJ8_9PLEO|nr:hypothetical protein EJ02DRAFT_72976 [Clathrospora elynae]
MAVMPTLGSESRKKKPNLSALAREFCLQYDRLKARSASVQSKQSRLGANQRFNASQEQLQSTMQYIFDLVHPSGTAPPIGKGLVTRWLVWT